MRSIALLLATCLTATLVIAQRFDDKHPPNTYRNADNPHFWKNRPPYPGDRKSVV